MNSVKPTNSTAELQHRDPGINIRLYQSPDAKMWDEYVISHPDSTHCHLSGWKEVIENTYHHKTYYLIAERCSTNPINSINLSREMRSPFHWDPTNPINPKNSINSIVGILPLVHIKSFIFGNHLVSMPFLNYGGILTDNEEIERTLLSEAINLGKKLKVRNIELRHLNLLSCLNESNSTNLSRLPCNEYARGEMQSLFHRNPRNPTNPSNPINCVTKTHKVRMLLNLPDSKEELLKFFKAKLRSQITRPQKEGMTSVIGGRELVDPFYKVFSINMRDLGSPVHSKKLFEQICNVFPQNVKIGIVHYQTVPVAAGLIICFRDTVEIPWASSLKKFNKLSPNMLLYWSFMEYTCDSGFKYFDFGRSTPDEGTYRFKEQWGAKPSPLYWHNIFLNGKSKSNNSSEKSKFKRAVGYWEKLPVPISNIIGPFIRKSIDL